MFRFTLHQKVQGFAQHDNLETADRDKPCPYVYLCVGTALVAARHLRYPPHLNSLPRGEETTPPSIRVGEQRGKSILFFFLKGFLIYSEFVESKVNTPRFLNFEF